MSATAKNPALPMEAYADVAMVEIAAHILRTRGASAIGIVSDIVAKYAEQRAHLLPEILEVAGGTTPQPKRGRGRPRHPVRTERTISGDISGTDEPRPPFINPLETITEDGEWIVCLEDGKKYKMLKRVLARCGMTPDDYRKRWRLPDDYPMVAPAYALRVQANAKRVGLGTKEYRQNASMHREAVEAVETVGAA